MSGNKSVKWLIKTVAHSKTMDQKSLIQHTKLPSRRQLQKFALPIISLCSHKTKYHFPWFPTTYTITSKRSMQKKIENKRGVKRISSFSPKIGQKTFKIAIYIYISYILILGDDLSPGKKHTLFNLTPLLKLSSKLTTLYVRRASGLKVRVRNGKECVFICV